MPRQPEARAVKTPRLVRSLSHCTDSVSAVGDGGPPTPHLKRTKARRNSWSAFSFSPPRGSRTVGNFDADVSEGLPLMGVAVAVFVGVFAGSLVIGARVGHRTDPQRTGLSQRAHRFLSGAGLSNGVR